MFLFSDKFNCPKFNIPNYVGTKKYSAEKIARSFEYFALLSLYRRHREDYELPSIPINTEKNYFQDCEWLEIRNSKLDDKHKSYFVIRRSLCKTEPLRIKVEVYLEKL